MRTLKIGFSRNKHDKIGSLVLQKYMKRDYSHCFVIFDTASKLGDDSVYHSAVQSGVGFMSMKVFLEDNIITKVYEIEVPDDIYFQIRKALFSECGRKYGFWQNIGVGIVDLFAKYGLNLKNPFPKYTNCSELLYRHVFQIAYNINDYDPDLVTPANVEEILKRIA